MQHALCDSCTRHLDAMCKNDENCLQPKKLKDQITPPTCQFLPISTKQMWKSYGKGRKEKGHGGTLIVWKGCACVCVWQSCGWQFCVWKSCVWKSGVWQSCVCGWQCCVWKSCLCVWQRCLWQCCVWQTCVKETGMTILCLKELCVKVRCVKEAFVTICCVRERERVRVRVRLRELCVCVPMLCVWTIWKDVKLLLPILPVPSSCYFWHGKRC